MNIYKHSTGDLIALDKVERVIRYTEQNGYGGIFGHMLQFFFESGKEITYKYKEKEKRDEDYDRICEQMRVQDSSLEHKEECSEEDKKIADRIYKALLGTEHVKILHLTENCEQWVSRWRLEDLNRVFKEFGVEVERCSNQNL